MIIMTDMNILKRCKERDIEVFVHFTNVINLPSILSLGLHSREELDNWYVDYSYNDSIRMDEAKDAVSLSVSSPNYRMFYKLRCINPKTQWCVILLDALEILKLDCAFCYTNAASACITDIPIENRKSFDAFEQMFANELFGNKREVTKVEEYETTDPQAEVLVFEPIPVSAIKYIVFDSYDIMNQYKPIISEHSISCAVDRGHYAPRRDYEYWR